MTDETWLRCISTGRSVSIADISGKCGTYMPYPHRLRNSSDGTFVSVDVIGRHYDDPRFASVWFGTRYGGVTLRVSPGQLTHVSFSKGW